MEKTNIDHEEAVTEASEVNEEQRNHAEEEPVNEAAAELSSELERYKQLVEEHEQRLLRAQADFDNFRRRSRQEKEDFAKYASLNLIEQLLPVVDNFERALAAGTEAKDAEALSKGVEMIFRQLGGVLEQEGLKVIEAAGRPFDPEFHQAIMQVESEEHEEGVVVEEVQKGYMLKDKVIRPSMVKVSS